jgi:hypothetical protein
MSTRAARRKFVPKEADEQRAVVQWLRLKRVLFCAVPNGGWRSKAEAAIFIGLGLERGVPDILIFDPPPANEHAVGVALEMKRQKGGRLSPEQKGWLQELADRRWVSLVARGAKEAIGELQKLGY